MDNWVYRRPYRRPPQRQRWIPDLVAVPVTVTPDAVALTLTSFAPALRLQLIPSSASLSLTSFAPTVTVAAAQQYYRSLTIDHNLVPNTDQSDFPVLVSFTDDDLKSISNGGHVASTSGFDILFFSDVALTSQLSHEIEKYDPAIGEVIAWVKLPTVSHLTDTTFYVKYGDSSITSSQEDAPDTWSNDFVGVWHLDGVSLSSVNSVTGAAGTINGVIAGTGKLNGGADFTGGAATDDIRTDISSNNADRTYEIWAKRDGDGGGGFGRIFVKGTTGSEIACYHDPTTFSPDVVYKFDVLWSSSIAQWSIVRPSSGVFHSLAITYNNSSDANDPLIYLNGSPATVTERVAPSGSVTTTAEVHSLGNRITSGNRKWDGQLDEFRISNVIRSADWLKTCYNNQNGPSAFVAVGAEVEVGDILVIPAPATLTTVRFAPVLQLRVTPTQVALTLTSFAPLVTQIHRVTPANATLTTTTFASSVTIKVTVPNASLSLTTFAPVVTVSADVSVTPATASLTLTSFAAQLREVVTPASQSLVLASFAPRLAQAVIPATATLSLTSFAPAVRTNSIITPASTALTLTTTTPQLLQVITVSVASLSLASFAPTVVAEADVTVTPDAQSLTLVTFAPVLRQQLTPTAATLSLATFAPTLRGSVTPATALLALSGFVPALQEQLTPSATSLTTTTFAPTITVSADKVAQPTNASLTLQTFAPQLRLVVTPVTAVLTASTNAPSLQLVVQPEVVALNVFTFAPTIEISADATVTPAQANLTLATFAPTVTAGGVTTTITPASATLTLTSYAPWLFLGLVPANRTFVVESGVYEVAVSVGEYEFLDEYEDSEVFAV